MKLCVNMVAYLLLWRKVCKCKRYWIFYTKRKQLSLIFHLLRILLFLYGLQQENMIFDQLVSFQNPILWYSFSKSFIVWFYLISQEFFACIQRELMPPLRIRQRKENLPIWSCHYTKRESQEPVWVYDGPRLSSST